MLVWIINSSSSVRSAIYITDTKLASKYSQLSLPTLHSNVLGMLIVVYVGLITALILHHADRPPRTDDIRLDPLREDEDEHTKTY
ncbi:hypothetical protein SprV_0200697400 [Sparganum proliferum]